MKPTEKTVREIIYNTLAQDITKEERQYLRDIVKVCGENQKLIVGKLKTRPAFNKELELLRRFNGYQETIDIIENKLRYITETETQHQY